MLNMKCFHLHLYLEVFNINITLNVIVMLIPIYFIVICWGFLHLRLERFLLITLTFTTTQTLTYNTKKPWKIFKIKCFFFQILSLMFSYSILIWIYILKRSFIVNFGISDVVVLVMKILKTPFLFSSLKFILPLKRMHDLSLNKLKKSPFHSKCSSCISQLCRILSFFFFLQINAVARKRR